MVTAKGLVQQMLHSRGLMMVRTPPEGSLERELQRVIEQRPVKCLLDVGAHEGAYAATWRRLGFGGRIISFEPAHAAHQRLRARATDWEVHQVAIGETDGTAEFHEYAEHTEFASLHQPSGRAGMPTLTVSNTYEVSVRTLDGLVAELGVDPASTFVKIDTQGHDAAVLSGGAKTLALASGVQIEVPMFGLYEGSPRAEDLIARVRDIGFDLLGMYPVHEHPRPLVPIEFDALFARSGEAPG